MLQWEYIHRGKLLPEPLIGIPSPIRSFSNISLFDLVYGGEELGDLRAPCGHLRNITACYEDVGCYFGNSYMRTNNVEIDRLPGRDNLVIAILKLKHRFIFFKTVHMELQKWLSPNYQIVKLSGSPNCQLPEEDFETILPISTLLGNYERQTDQPTNGHEGL